MKIFVLIAYYLKGPCSTLLSKSFQYTISGRHLDKEKALNFVLVKGY
jgi:hypothetical protein